MTILEQKYKEFNFNEEFTDLYILLLYESGGDFKTYSSIIGYTDYSQFIQDLVEFIIKYSHKFYKFE